VSVIYFRSGHDASDYRTSTEWEARVHLERSYAIKCPPILTQLAGTKKIQEALARPGALLRFVGPESATRLSRTFATIYPLDATSAAGQTARRLARDPESAQNYILKPQREGGGHNIHGTAITPYLLRLPETLWPSHILMKRIDPPPTHNSMIRNGIVTSDSVISELGIYGACLWRNSSNSHRLEILHNEGAGWLLRTKSRMCEEGGIIAGYGYLDSLCLV
jgi:glutathione synthetase